jgi:hypothetical protein
VRAWRSPFGLWLHVLVLTRGERRFIRLGEDFDVAQVLDGAYWLLGGVLDKEIDGIELVTDVGGRHRPWLCRQGWLALVPSGWTGGAEFHLLKDGRVVESHQVDELESFIDRGWTFYAPLEAD